MSEQQALPQYQVWIKPISHYDWQEPITVIGDGALPETQSRFFILPDYTRIEISAANFSFKFSPEREAIAQANQKAQVEAQKSAQNRNNLKLT